MITKPETHNAKQPSIGAETITDKIVRIKNMIEIINRAVESFILFPLSSYESQLSTGKLVLFN